MYLLGYTTLGFIAAVLANDSPMEYCQSEEFTGECPTGHVIQMDYALYGRMGIGRCVTTDFGYHCINNVLHYMDAYCSGSRSCSVRIDQTSFPASKQCHNDLKSFLQANYTCIPVVAGDSAVCRGPPHAVTVPMATGWGNLASSVTRETGCGGADAYWVIRARKGQSINITMTDYSLVRLPSSSSSTSSSTSTAASSYNSVSGCRVYATIREDDPSAGPGRSHTICGGRHRTSQQYVSMSHVVQVRFLNTRTADPQADVNFLLRYEVMGCATPVTPPGGLVSRIGDRVTVTCRNPEEEWTLTCIGNHWHGRAGNCTAESPAATNSLMEKIRSLPHGISMVIIVAIAAVIGLSILLVGLVCLRWKRKSLLATYNTPSTQSGYTSQAGGVVTSYAKGALPHPPQDNTGVDMYAGMQNHNEYASMKYNQAMQDRPNGIPSYDGNHYREHIYESPDLMRRESPQEQETGTAPRSNSRPSCGEGPQYFDLDPRRMQAGVMLGGGHSDSGVTVAPALPPTQAGPPSGHVFAAQYTG